MALNFTPLTLKKTLSHMNPHGTVTAIVTLNRAGTVHPQATLHEE